MDSRKKSVDICSGPGCMITMNLIASKVIDCRISNQISPSSELSSSLIVMTSSGFEIYGIRGPVRKLSCSTVSDSNK